MLIYLVAKWRGNETLDIPGCEHVYEQGFIYLKVVNPYRGIKLKSQYKKKRLPPLAFDNLGLAKWHGSFMLFGRLAWGVQTRMSQSLFCLS